jgi:hypothetical protein
VTVLRTGLDQHTSGAGVAGAGRPV